MSAQEETQEVTITESSQFSSLIEKQITREKNRLRQIIYRRKRREKEIELREKYQQLQSRFHTMQIRYHVAIQQNILLTLKAQEYKDICQSLINHLTNQRPVPERKSPEIECIEIDDHEEIREEIVNDTPSFSNEIKIGDTTIQYENNTMPDYNWVSTALEGLNN